MKTTNAILLLVFFCCTAVQFYCCCCSLSEKSATSKTTLSYTPYTTLNEVTEPVKKEIPFSSPLHDYARMTSSYGYRISPISGNYCYHKGVDLACNKGTPVYASAAGKIISRSYDSTYGNYVIISHEDGYKTKYAHLNDFGVYTVGEYVSRNSVIGYVGSTGQSTGPHCHFEIYKNDSLIDPCSKVTF